MVRRSTIAALATSPTPAGIAVIRISGADAGRLLVQLFRGARSPVEHPRYLCFGEIASNDGARIDEGYAVFLPAPHSFTGEDVAELQFHGSPLVTQKVLRSLFEAGAIAAQPGEFSQRAFLNGKRDLLQIEAISDLISATSEESLRVASHQLEGRLSKMINHIAEPLRDTLARLEAGLDFSDDGVSQQDRAITQGALRAARDEIARLLSTYQLGQRLRDGLRVVLAGLPNVGKSSLLNALVGRRRALVSPEPGTTRDLIEESIQLQGHRVVLCDVAGIRETSHPIEAEGIALAREQIRSWAHVVVLVVDATQLRSSAWRELYREIRAISPAQVVVVLNKIDLVSTEERQCADRELFELQHENIVSVSTVSGAGLSELEELFTRLIISGSNTDAADSSSVVTSERHRNCLVRALDALDRALADSDSVGDEILAHHVRVALAQLDELVGRTYTEDILGKIFSTFCIGK